MLSELYAIALRWALRGEEDGQALAEYALILGFIAVVAVAALTLLGTILAGELGEVTDGFGGGGS
jgi:Flp pilus assembly pilin Flp